ncbi:MAG: hypothetical protein PVSMB7_08490 [Chloroflexota bacterium]
MASLVVLIVLLFAIGTGVSKLVAKNAQSGLDDGPRAAGSTLNPERVFLHLLSFAGLIALLYALTGLLTLLLFSLTPNSGTVLSSTDARTRASYYLAALLVGTPLWYWCWSNLQRRAARSIEERNALERRLFLAAVFSTTAIVALVGLHTFLEAAFMLPAAADAAPDVRNTIVGGTRGVVWAVAWFLYARLGWRERNARDADGAHDLGVYVVAGCALSFLMIGGWEAIRQIFGDVTQSASSALLGGTSNDIWTIWSAIAAWSLAGGGIWGAVWQYDLARGGRRLWRVRYLYLVVVVAAVAALAGGTDTLYELLRIVFGYRDTGGMWRFLQDSAPPLLVGSAVWTYHWMILRRQTARDEPDPACIPWPRRPAIVLLALLGLATAIPAFVSLLWLALDSVISTGASVSSGSWWRDRASISIAGAVIGAAVWLMSWSKLQRAAAADPERERTAPERQRLLGLIVLLSALAAVGFSIATLWLTFQLLLGAARDAGTVDWALKDLSAVVITLTAAIYHAQIFRREQRQQPTSIAPPRILALLAPGAEELRLQLMAHVGRSIDIAGYLSTAPADTGSSLTTLSEQLLALHAGDRNDTVLLILGPQGGTLYSYTRANSRQADATPTTMLPTKAGRSDREPTDTHDSVPRVPGPDVQPT